MKRFLSVLISMIIAVVSVISAFPVYAEEQLTEYIVPFYSDKCLKSETIGLSNKQLLGDGIVYIPVDIASEIAGAEISAKTEKGIVISRNYISLCLDYGDKKNQYLLIDKQTGDGDYYDAALNCLFGSSLAGKAFEYHPFMVNQNITYSIDESLHTSIPFVYHKNILYVSLIDFLDTFGVTIKMMSRNEMTDYFKSISKLLSQKTYTSANYEAMSDKFCKISNLKYNNFFSFYLGIPADELYTEYYNLNQQICQCPSGENYSDREISSANISSAFAAYSGPIETVCASFDINTIYSQQLITILSCNGKSVKNQDVDFFQIIQAFWNAKSIPDDFKSIKTFDSSSGVQGSDIVSVGLQSVCGACGYYQMFMQLDSLYENSKTLLRDSIISSSEYKEKAEKDGFWNYAFSSFMYAFGGLNPDTTLNLENSHNNLYNSAKEVQNKIDTDSVAPGMFASAIQSGLYAAMDTMLLKSIDKVVFQGVPVATLFEECVSLTSSVYNQSEFAKAQKKIADFDDYIFIQNVSMQLFKSYSINSKNAFSSFLLGIKSSITAYETLNETYNTTKYNENIEELVRLLSISSQANTDFYHYRNNTTGGEDLTELLYVNTDVSNLQTGEREIYRIDSSEIIQNDDTILPDAYDFIQNTLVPQYGLSDLATYNRMNSSNFNILPESTKGIISAQVGDFDQNGCEDIIMLTIDGDNYYIYYYSYNKAWSLCDTYSFLYQTNTEDIFSSNCSYNISISYKGDKLMLYRHYGDLNGNRNGDMCAVFKVQESALDNILSFDTYHVPGYNIASINQEVYSNNSDFKLFETNVISKLRDVGLSASLSVHNVGQMQLDFLDDEMIFEELDCQGENMDSTEFIDFTRLRDHINATNSTPLSTDWKKLYAEKLNQVIESEEYNELFAFDLHDISGDEIPELFISQGDHNYARCVIYYISNNKIEEVSVSFSDMGQYAVNENYLFSCHFINGGYYEETVYSNKDNKLVETATFSNDDGAVPTEQATWKYNGVSVSQEEYRVENSKYGDAILVGRQYKLDKKTVQSVLSEKEEYTGAYSGSGVWENVLIVLMKFDEEKANASIFVQISNPSGTRVSEAHQTSSFDGTTINFEADDGYGINKYTLRHEGEKWFLSAENKSSYGVWSIPEIKHVEIISDNKYWDYYSDLLI